MGKKKSSAKKAANAAASRGVVGPNYFQVLTGSIASKSISLILCGESHNDAIDITRAGGGKVKEGWEPTDYQELTAELVGRFGGIRDEDDANNVRIKVGMCKQNKKLLPLGKAKDWGKDIGSEEYEYMEPGHEMALLWVPSRDNPTKGKSYLIEVFIDEVDDDSSSDEEVDAKKKEGMFSDRLKKMKRKSSTDSTSHHPTDVGNLMDMMLDAAKQMRGIKSLSKILEDMKNGKIPGHDEKPQHTLLQWADMDNEARSYNHRRLLGEDIPIIEHDTLIHERKMKRRQAENLWTFDDWLLEVKSKLLTNDVNGENPSLHVLLEIPIPPSEVELCKDIMPEFKHTQAGDCIRCISQDSSESSIDQHDPSADGSGGYMDYIYRRVLEFERNMKGDSDSGNKKDKFLHCIDCRDLGCEHECVAEDKEEWLKLLDPEEKEKLLGKGSDATHAHHKNGRCLPDWSHSPEETELDRLRSNGTLKNDDSDCDDKSGEEKDKDEDEHDLLTFPSFENFFNISDIMYYTPNVKVSYAPFLGKVVKSFDNWNSFYGELFFGGTVDQAISMLDLASNSGPYLHTRSPIMKFWNVKTGSYSWHKRDNEENDLTLPLLPINSFLKARGSNPPRTWSSNIFASLMESEDQGLRDMATHVRDWTLNNIAKQCSDPKLADDEIGGGEWFIAYLRQCHRDIYDDIDTSDQQELLRKTNAQGEKKKHKIGNIKIPSCEEGFKMITEELEKQCDDKSVVKPTFSRNTEVMAKICIDIYNNKLVDFSTLTKILQIISQETERKNITIVCYMGSCHTKGICDFFMPHGFKKQIYCGKEDWEDDEGMIIHLPPELWDVKSLHK